MNSSHAYRQGFEDGMVGAFPKVHHHFSSHEDYGLYRSGYVDGLHPRAHAPQLLQLAA